MLGLQYLKELVERCSASDKTYDEQANDAESFNVHSFNMAPRLISMHDKVVESMIGGQIKSIQHTEEGYVVNDCVVITHTGEVIGVDTNETNSRYHTLRDTMVRLGMVDFFSN